MWLSQRWEEFEQEILPEVITDVEEIAFEPNDEPCSDRENWVENLKLKIIAEETQSRESRYVPLADWLQSQPGNVDQLKLSFAQIEQIIGGDLPNSAYNHRAWWANDSVAHYHSRLWLEVGWRRSYLNMSGKHATFVRIKEREKAYIDFFSQLFPELREKVSFSIKEFPHGGQSWMETKDLSALGSHIGSFTVSFARGSRIRVELYIDTGDQDANKKIFDLIRNHQEELETKIGKIAWERIDDKRASRIALYHPGSITDDSETLAKLQNWAVDNMIIFYNAIEPIASKAAAEVLAK